MNKVFFFRRLFSLHLNYKLHSLLFIGAMFFTFLISSTLAQTDVQNLAVVVNALDNDNLNITSSLSIIDLDEPNLKRAVDKNVITIGYVPTDILIHGHIAYVPRFLLDWNMIMFFDSILIINLEQREIIGEIPIQPGAYPQSLALINPNKMYVTCDRAHQVHVVDIGSRSVTKIITDASFNKTTGLTVLNGKAYVTNPAWEWDAAAGKSIYHQSSVTVIDTQTDSVLKSIPMPINAGGILNDGDSTVIVKTTGDRRQITGKLVLIDATTDEIIKTVDTGLTPGSFAINSQKQLFIQGGGLLIYDVPTQKWIRNRGNKLAEFGGGSGMVFGPDGNLYITKPDWTGSGLSTMLVMGPDETLIETYQLWQGPDQLAHGTDKVALVQIVPRDEDINDDGFVDITDLVIVSQNFGQRGPGIAGDVNEDGEVNVLDLILVVQHF
ncbi:MAG: dockerin type I domain-containing protein [Candidatus Poribacteria bacterium]|nr:dockerin type I domain-containing protein [Candidatus Poribacteria bacterium]